MTVLLSTIGQGVGRAVRGDDGWSVDTVLAGADVRTLAVGPDETVWAGTQGQGILRSLDRGMTWAPSGLDGGVVKSIAFGSAGTVFAGLKPASVWRTQDDGASWHELEGFRRTRRPFWFSPAERPFAAYVLGLAVSGETVIAGIEAGAVVRSTDGGETWEGHRPGALRDCHTLASCDGRFYEAGGSGGGAAWSTDGGATWRRPSGHDLHYGWACAAAAADAGLWYFSAAPGVVAHGDHAAAAVFRCDPDGRCVRLAGLPEPLDAMPYGLLAGPAPGEVTAGLSNGEVWRSLDHGESWCLEVRLPRIDRVLVRLV
jgi:photosystem II stability/assembly factor-like uncharacterized protein